MQRWTTTGRHPNKIDVRRRGNTDAQDIAGLLDATIAPPPPPPDRGEGWRDAGCCPATEC